MQSNELETIAASMQDALGRAYSPPGSIKDVPLDYPYPLGTKH